MITETQRAPGLGGLGIGIVGPNEGSDRTEVRTEMKVKINIGSSRA